MNDKKGRLRLRPNWLYPGLEIKRWIFLGTVGLVFLLLGALTFLNWIFRLKLLSWQPVWGSIFLITGVLLSLAGFYKSLRFIEKLGSKSWPEKIFREKRLEQGPKVVTIGGGTGLPNILRGLKKYTANITAIVTVADDGGSSGILRDQMGVLPPGDIRNCLVALADTEPLMKDLFQYRFTSGEGLKGHSFGNLFIATLTDLLGDFEEAIKESSKVLAIRGRVLPSTLDDVVLKAEFVDGSTVEGESEIPRVGKKIKKIWLKPEDNKILPEARKALQEADLVIIGPGSLYTSILPNLLVGGMVEALSETGAARVYVCNIMTQAGETEGFKASDHVKAILQHTGNRKIFDYIIVNESEISPVLTERYRQEGSFPVKVDREELKTLGLKVIAGNLATEDIFIRHNPDRLMELLSEIKLNKEK